MAFLSFAFAVALLCVFALWKRSQKQKKTPDGFKELPGPKGWPVLGSVPEVPEQNSFLKFHEWGLKYGKIYQVDLAGTNHVWISSDEIARDLLSKKGAIYSDRPHIPALIDDNRTSAQYLPLLSKNDGWQRQRKFANVIMRESEKADFHHYPELEAKRMLVELMNDPSKYNHSLESFVARVTCRLAWGHSEASEELKQRARELLISVSPTGALGNKLPFVMSLPDWLSPAKAWERKRAKTERRFFEIMQAQVQGDMKGKRAPHSWMRTFLENPTGWNFTYELEGAYSVGMHGIAGALTIAAPMQTFCLAMCHYPQYQSMLHEELDRVCGDRLPESSDRPNLPVLRAFIRECFRWRPPVPTGIPHFLTEDDTWNGYFIPKGSVMHPLEYSISRDPDIFPDGDSFNPNRWLDPKYPSYKEPLTQYPTILNCTQFGYGRRICQGQGVAEVDLLVSIASIAWLFKIQRNEEPTPEPETTNGMYGNEKATISIEELNAGFMPPPAPSQPHPYNGTDGSPIPSSCPGAYILGPEDEIKEKPKKKKIDPTHDYTKLLIAKPYPFTFNLEVRNHARAEIVKNEFVKCRADGKYEDPKTYWKEGGELGWVPVYS
ncbi:cytochrome P450 [Lineolata rhizophorae]|uniref:Cytochrome P450 n=1 Tax=Lineolata rhizophorae TaxID=578093 RepID=A0A6A6PBR7_9PEZI|nr:cytochrome P450 [Lineolata rhizophorae]